MFDVNTVVSDIKLSINFENKLNVLIGNSGVGKTFLMRLLEDEYANSGLNISIFDYRLAKSNGIQEYIKLASQSDLVLLDNADLFMNKKLFNILLLGKCTVVTSIKDLTLVPCGDVGRYIIIYEENSLKVKRVE